MVQTEPEEIFKALVEPFSEKVIKFREVRRNSSQVLAYIEARDVMRRLDEVVGPLNWRDEYRHVSIKDDKGKDMTAVVCSLSLRVNGEWLTKEDGAENTQIEEIKGGISDAFKRAAVKWGIGRYLYYLPNMYMNNGQKPSLPKWALPGETGVPDPSVLEEWQKPDDDDKPVERHVFATPSDLLTLGRAVREAGRTMNDPELCKILGVDHLDQTNASEVIGNWMGKNSTGVNDLISLFKQEVEA